MSWREIAQSIDLEIPAWKAHAFDYLESAGLVFCTHFGTDNAMEMARAHWRNRPRLHRNERRQAPENSTL